MGTWLQTIIDFVIVALCIFAVVRIITGIRNKLEEKKLEEIQDDLPVYDGELYLELHRGTLTQMHDVKRKNRKVEFALQDDKLRTQPHHPGSPPETESGLPSDCSYCFYRRYSSLEGSRGFGLSQRDYLSASREPERLLRHLA